MDDTLLKEFINESREHLATIESDLLAIEERGADIDEAMVNKVFRAAHSIKGGSGFFGHNSIKELAHKAETVLDMLRARKMTPNAEVINVLLAAFDRLREMINSFTTSDGSDISDLLVGLVGLATSYLPQEKKASMTQQVTLRSSGGAAITLPKLDFERAQEAGNFIYSVELDLIHDIEKQGKNIFQIFSDIEMCGEIMECVMDFEAVGTLDDVIGNRLPILLIFSSVIDPVMIGVQLDTVSPERVELLYGPSSGQGTPVMATPVVSPAVPAARISPPSPSPVLPEGPVSLPLSSPPGSAPLQDEEASLPLPPPEGEKARSTGTQGSSAAADETLRVNVGLLETLMNLAGELVLSRNQLRAAVDQKNMQARATANQRINQVTSELQDVIMQTRLQPIGTVFGKFPRVVRDMSMSLGKDIQVDIRGKEVALDKSLIEGLSDPLTHMVRNAVDHGIESVEERVRAGKKAKGTMRIEARHEAGHVVVEIEDDGKGIDPRRVSQAAVSKGLVPSEKVQAMSDRDKLALIFLPGLSTAQKVSDISGRGVGMDVVKTNLDRIGGKVEITSEMGKGTLFSIKLPLTLAIIPSLIVSVEEERFAIPQINIEELLHLRAEDVKRRIEVVGSSEVLLLRDRILPLVRFDQVLGITPTYVDPVSGRREIDRRVNLADRRSPRHGITEDAGGPAGSSDADAAIASRRRTDGRRFSAASSLEIAVVTTGTMSYGLVVGAFHDTEEIVVKPLGRQFKSLREYAGATILGDGMVALILDIPGLALKAELTSLSGTTRAADLAKEAEKERLQDAHALLLFHNAPDEICALPLDSVQRLERITPLQLEQAGGKRTMQYRGSSLPLVALSDAARVKYIDETTEELAVLVCNVHGRDVGLLGTMPVDVIETRALIDQATHRQTGIAGSAIINERTTLILDLFELIDSLFPDWAGARAVQCLAPAGEGGKITILLAEDSDFFRSQVKRFLEEDGFEVLEAPDGEAAWDLLVENLSRVRVVVTDIEMPLLNGLGLTRRIRADERTARLPIIAVTSLAGDDEVAMGRAAGIDDYQVKLDRDQLLSSVHTYAAGG